jgi:hypothetical protein
MVEAQGFPTERGQVLSGRTKLWEVGLVGKAPKWGKLKGAKAWEKMSMLGQNLWWSVGERRRNLCSAAPVFTLPLWRSHAVCLLHKKNATEDRHTWVHKMLMPYDRTSMCSNNGLGSHCCNSVLQQWPQVMMIAYFLEKQRDTHERPIRCSLSMIECEEHLKISQNSWPLDWDLNSDLLKFKAGVLTS